MARYREVARLREGWIAQGSLQVGDETDLQLLRHVLLEAEHTWGTDTKTWLDFDNYMPADLARMLDTKNYKVVEFSWIEKRQDLLDGVATLPEALREEAELAIASSGSSAAADVAASQLRMRQENRLRPNILLLAIDPQDGRDYAAAQQGDGARVGERENPIALLTYQTLSQEDYQRFMASYLTTKADWAQKDFGKPNIEQIWREEPGVAGRNRPR